MVKRVLTLGLLLLFLFHFSMTALFNSPLNPVKAKFNDYVMRYMDPLFMQNWRLFAPNPVNNNNHFYVRAKLKEDGEEQTTDWIDLTSYMIERNHANRFTPYNRIVRIQRGAMTMMGEDNDLLIMLHRKADENEEIKKTLKKLGTEERRNERQEDAENLLNRYAQAYLHSLYPEQEITATQVMVVVTEGVPFSKKDEANFERKEEAFQFRWQQVQSVDPMF